MQCDRDVAHETTAASSYEARRLAYLSPRIWAALDLRGCTPQHAISMVIGDCLIALFVHPNVQPNLKRVQTGSQVSHG
jgi:hypothetical protein